ncbi:MAG: hypothetical protein AMXMBFR83_09640 [Phycisphaerae bacterium]
MLQADGGTRTAAITGAYVALADAVRWLRSRRLLGTSPIREAIAAVSVGKVAGRLLLDLNYQEDSRADLDFNVAMTASGAFVEIQGTAEAGTFTQEELDRMLKLARSGIRELITAQERALRTGGRRRG